MIGPNGAGKTTLLSILAGARAPTEGTVSREPEGVGWVPQAPALYSKLSVAENLRLFARLEKVPRRRGGGAGRCSSRPGWPTAPETRWAASRAATSSA